VGITGVTSSQICARHGAGEKAAARTAQKAASADPDVIALAESYLAAGSGFWNPVDPDLIAEDFVFRGEYIGPLNKEDYVQTMRKLKPYSAFPDMKPNAFGFTVDPQDPLRVWFFVRNTGTNTKPWVINGVVPLTLPATGNELKGTVESYSMLFSPTGKLRYLTVGYSANKYEGNAGGVGAAFALFNVMGYGALAKLASQPFVRDFGNWYATIDPQVPKSRSEEKDLPAWYSE